MPAPPSSVSSPALPKMKSFAVPPISVSSPEVPAIPISTVADELSKVVAIVSVSSALSPPVSVRSCASGLLRWLLTVTVWMASLASR